VLDMKKNKQKSRRFSGTSNHTSAEILEQSMGARNRVGIELSYWPLGYKGRRNRFLRIDSCAP
jgi:hypothetical protein